MKIELDLSDIFYEGDDPCDLQEAIKAEVVRVITGKIHKGIGHAVEIETAKVIQDELQSAVRDQMPALIEDLMNAEYTSVDRYGSQGGPTTFRKELIAEINRNMVYKAARYDSEKNAFTKAVDSTMAEKLREFKQLFNKTVDSTFVAEAMDFAAKKLAERLKISK
jgi:hypothetical protein